MKKIIAEGSGVVFLNILGQAFVFVFFVYIAKIYPEAEIGEYFAYGAVAAIIGVIATGYYEQALYLVKRHKSVQGVAWLLITICALVSVVSSLIGGYFYSDSYYFLGITVFASGLTRLFVTFNILEARLLFNAFLHFIGVLIVPSMLLLNAAYGVNQASYMIAISSITSFFVASISLFIVCQRSQFDISKKPTLKVMRLYWLKYIDFLRLSTVAELFSTAALRLPIFLASEFFSKVIAATYGLVFRIVLSPILIVVGYFSQRFLSEISQIARNSADPKPVFYQYTKILLVYAVAQVLGIALLVDEIFLLAFGELFQQGPEMVMAALPWITGMTLVSPVVNVFIVYQRQDIIFQNKVTYFFISIVSFFLGWVESDFILGLRIFSWTMFFLYISMWLRARTLVIKFSKI